MIKVKNLCFWLLFTTCLWIGAIQAVEQDVEIYTTQDRHSLGDSITTSILEAKESVLIFTFSLSDSKVIDALNQKAKEGLKVTVVIDKDHLGQISSLGAKEIEIFTRKEGEGHLHHKILVVDGSLIWIGSANFTSSAYNQQENLMVKFNSEGLASYLENEAKVFKNEQNRSDHGPLPIVLENQTVYFCLLPHDGFPQKKLEKSINDQSKQFLIEQIRNAKTSLQIAMMVWTNNDLTEAVISAYRRGVEVEVVAPDFGGNLPKLMSAGIKVNVNSQLSFMHNKFMCVDGCILVNGSANWSQSSFTRSDESFVVIEPMSEFQKDIFQNYWDYLIGE